jgi:multidrug efflux pump subunit AcrA (membrane-fusion protein)
MATVSTANSLNSASLAGGQPQQRLDPGADGPAAPDPQLVAEMKHEINTLVQEITRLAADDISLEEFFSGFLGRVVSSMAAVGGAVWTPGESGRLALQYQINLAQTGAEATQSARTQHAQLIKGVVDGKQAILAAPSSGSANGGGAGNPTELLLVMAPLVVESQAQGVVEIFQRPGGAPSTQRGYLRFLVQMCDLACGYLKSRRLRQLEENHALWRQLETLVSSLHRSLDVRETAYAIVNEGRRMIGCDRVSLAIWCGGSCQIEAVSGLDSIDRRAAEVKGLAKLAAAVVQAGEPLWSDGSDDDLPRQIHGPLQEYIDRSHARLIAVLPLTPKGPDEPATRQRPIGALIVEQMREGRATETLRTRTAIVAHHSAGALVNAIEHSSLFLLPVWKTIGQVTWLFRGRTLPKTLLALGLLAGGVYALATVPTDFEVAARGKLQPAERREIFAPLDGLVAKVPVEHGQIVEAGATLAELTNTDLELQLAALLGRQTTNEERLTALSRALLDNKGGAARLAPAEENRLAGEMMQLRQEAQNIERELKLVREKQQQLRIVAPQRGQVVTWKVRDLLLQRPVVRGQGLLTLANPDGPWELELYLPERRLTHLQNARASQKAMEAAFVLSSHPGQTFRGQVVEVEQAAEVRGDEGNTVLVRVTVDKAQLPPLHDQTTVTAKLNCGRTSVGYAWFCDLIETVQSKVLFWLPS